MKLETLDLEGLYLVTPRLFEDERGFFYESYRAGILQQAGLNTHWPQDNHARSRKNTVRGLHFTAGEGQIKLIRCTRGVIWDVVVDIRPESPTVGQWTAVELSEANRAMLYVPAGFAHGYAALIDGSECQYKCSTEYQAELDRGILWNDPEIGIEWPVDEPILSEKDRAAPSLSEYLASRT